MATEIHQRDYELAKLFSSYVNGKMCSCQNVAFAMAHEHRYLVQQMYKVCVAFLHVLSIQYEKGDYDGRNENAVKGAAKYVESNPDDEIWSSERNNYEELSQSWALSAAQSTYEERYKTLNKAYLVKCAYTENDEKARKKLGDAFYNLPGEAVDLILDLYKLAKY